MVAERGRRVLGAEEAAALEFGTAILAVSALSFLGFGATPPQPEWGLDEVVVTKSGRVTESGPADTILESARDPYTRALVDAVPRPGRA